MQGGFQAFIHQPEKIALVEFSSDFETHGDASGQGPFATLTAAYLKSRRCFLLRPRTNKCCGGECPRDKRCEMEVIAITSVSRVVTARNNAP
jgi:hypothetical protein